MKRILIRSNPGHINSHLCQNSFIFRDVNDTKIFDISIYRSYRGTSDISNIGYIVFSLIYRHKYRQKYRFKYDN